MSKQITHITLPVDLADKVTSVLLTLPAGQVFDLLTEMKQRAIVVETDTDEEPEQTDPEEE